MTRDYITLILLVLIYMMPEIRKQGAFLDRPICIEGCTSYEIQSVLEAAGLLNSLFTVGDNPTLLNNALRESNSSSVFIVDSGGGSVYMQQRVSQILNDISFRAGEQSGDGYFGIPIICVQGVSKSLIKEKAFKLVCDKLTVLDEEQVFDLLPLPTEIALAKTKVSDSFGDEYVGTERAFCFATAMLYPALERAGKSKIYDEIVVAVKSALDRAQENNQDLLGLMKDSMMRWILKGDYMVYVLPNLGMKATEAWNQSVYIDGGFAYVSDEMLEKMTADVTDLITYRDAKKILAEEGVLVSSEIGTYLNRMFYTDLGGKLNRKRMMKIAVERLNRIGNPDVMGILRSKGEQKYE